MVVVSLAIMALLLAIGWIQRKAIKKDQREYEKKVSI